MSRATLGTRSSEPARMPACLRKFRAPRSAIAMLRAVVVPPPPSSVDTNTLPMVSAAVSYIATLSNSRSIRQYGAPKARMAATQRLLGGIGQHVRRGEGHEVQRFFPGVDIEDVLGHRQQVSLEVVGDLLGDRSVGPPRTGAVQVSLMDRRGPPSRAEGGVVQWPAR